MNSIIDLIDRAIAGALSPAELEEALRGLAARDARAAAQARALVEARRGEGRLPEALYARLDACIAALGAAAGSPEDTGTRLKRPAPRAGTRSRHTAIGATDDGAASPPEETDTGTRLRRPVEPSDRTRMVGTRGADPRPGSPGAQGGRSGKGAPGRPAGNAGLAPHEPLAPGAVVKQRFLLLEQIGQGGMGSVFKARDQEYAGHEQLVALKFLTGELESRPEALSALEQEVRKTRKLAHPNVVTVYEFYRDGPLHFISMELLEGEPLDRLLRRHTAGGLPFAQAWPIIEGAGAALAYAHQQEIIHSDFKPGNVFLTDDGRVKVLDFGIARAARLDDEEFDVTVLGGLTPAYASPEMVLSLEPDPRDDVYALACVAYQLLSGRHPFDGTPAHRAQHAGMAVPKIKHLGRNRMRALEKGLAFTRDARTPSVERFLRELEAARQPGRIVRWGAVAAAGLILLAAGGDYLRDQLQRCTRLDAEFLDAMRARAAEQTVDASYRLLWLEQAEQALGVEEFDSALLSEGPSSALGAFTLLLAIDPSDELALNGILQVIERYRAEAERLFRLGAAEESLGVAETGLEIHPRHCGLNDVRARTAALLE